MTFFLKIQLTTMLAPLTRKTKQNKTKTKRAKQNRTMDRWDNGYENTCKYPYCEKCTKHHAICYCPAISMYMYVMRFQRFTTV